MSNKNIEQYKEIDFSDLTRSDQDLLVKYILKTMGFKLVIDRFDYGDRPPAPSLLSDDKIIAFRWE